MAAVVEVAQQKQQPIVKRHQRFSTRIPALMLPRLKNQLVQDQALELELARDHQLELELERELATARIHMPSHSIKMIQQ